MQKQSRDPSFAGRPRPPQAQRLPPPREHTLADQLAWAESELAAQHKLLYASIDEVRMGVERGFADVGGGGSGGRSVFEAFRHFGAL